MDGGVSVKINVPNLNELFPDAQLQDAAIACLVKSLIAIKV